MAQASAKTPQLGVCGLPDRHGLKPISAEKIQANIEKLVKFSNQIDSFRAGSGSIAAATASAQLESGSKASLNATRAIVADVSI